MDDELALEAEIAALEAELEEQELEEEIAALEEEEAAAETAPENASAAGLVFALADAIEESGHATLEPAAELAPDTVAAQLNGLVSTVCSALQKRAGRVAFVLDGAVEPLLTITAAACGVP